MSKNPIARSQARVLPPKFKNTMEIDYSLRLTWKERLKIAIGYRIDMKMLIHTEQLTGKFQAIPTHNVVNENPK